MAEMAQEEARERANKRRMWGVVPLVEGLSKRCKFSIVKLEDEESEEETPTLFIVVQVGDQRIPTYAFIDLGADGNTISFELFSQLNSIALKDTTAMFESFTGDKVKAHGMCELSLFVSELSCGDKFFVT